MKSRRNKTLHETVELNITAFLNLMVILVPFLLITAVFSPMTVLELTLPQLNSESNPDEKITLQLQMIVTPESIDVRDASAGRLQKFNIVAGKIKWQPVVDLLLAVKSRYPEEEAITLLVASDVSYNTLIEVMDHVRSAEIVNTGTLEVVALFPEVSIGDAPARVDSSNANSAKPIPSSEKFPANAGEVHQ